MKNFRSIDIKGFSPAVEATRSEELFVLAGRNYVFDSKGPRSIYGNRLLLPQPFTNPSQIQGVRLKLKNSSVNFTFTQRAVLSWDESLGGWKTIFEHPSLSDYQNRWTWGYLNELVFLCHPRVGILVYDPDNGLCVPHDGVGVPVDVLAITVNGGRLIAMGPEFWTWSAPSDGMDFNPTLGGAGFHKISNTVPGAPIMVTSYTGGCLTWTTGGVMRSEFTGDLAVYRHRPIQTEYRPANTFCVARLDEDSVVILDSRGLFRSKGDAITPYSPLFNEFLSRYIQDSNLEIGNNLRLEWDDLSRIMYVSVSHSIQNPLYEKAFALYVNLDKWGEFSEPHYGILPIQIAGTDRADDYFGFVDSEGRVRYWVNTGSVEKSPEDSASKLVSNLVYPVIQKPAIFDESDAGIILSSVAGINTVPTAEILQPAGYYLNDSGAPIVPERAGLNSLIRIGLLRPNGDMSADECSEVIGCMIRNLDTDNAVVGTGFNITPTALIENSNLNQGHEATGLGFGVDDNYVNHGLRIIGTLDGYTEFMSQLPSLVSSTRAARHFSCAVVGVWHMIELTAAEVGEAIHPVSVELTMIAAGRIN